MIGLLPIRWQAWWWSHREPSKLDAIVELRRTSGLPVKDAKAAIEAQPPGRTCAWALALAQKGVEALGDVWRLAVPFVVLMLGIGGIAAGAEADSTGLTLFGIFFCAFALFGAYERGVLRGDKRAVRMISERLCQPGHTTVITTRTEPNDGGEE